MNDLISRQAAIDAADRADYRWLAVEDVKKVTDEVVKELKQLPSAQQWIPCSERLPEKDGRYLCTYSDFGTCVDFGLYTDGQWIIEPVAWMPLPQPWGMDGDT